MKKITALLLIICFIVAGCGKQQKQEEGLSVFRNNVLAYEIQYRNPWRISENLSKRYSTMSYSVYLISEIGCDEVLSSFSGDEDDMNKDLDCFNNHPRKDEITRKIDKFINDWESSNSDIVFFTDWSNKEEEEFFKQVYDKKRDLTDVDFDEEISSRMISIYPSDSDFSFKEEKTTTNKNGKKLINEFVNLQDDVIGYKVDSRELGMSLTVHIPHSIKTNIGGKKSLILKTNITKDSNEEDEFYMILESLVFIK